jgi:predicted aspartyl protease
MANEVNIKIRADGRQATRSLDKVGDSAGKLGSRMRTIGKVAGGAAVAIGAIGTASAIVGAKMFAMAGQLELVENKVNTVFGDQRGLVGEWARETSAEMGLTISQTENLAAKFGDLLIPMGFTREVAASMSTSVVGLSGALAEWSGGTVGAAEAADILAKAMLGEREGLKTLGISIMEADVKARLMAQGQDKLTGASLQQAKALATQALIFEKSQDAQTAFAQGGDSLARTQAKLQAAVGELKESIVKALMPTFADLAVMLNERVIPVIINELIPYLEENIPKAIEAVTPTVKFLVDAFQAFWKMQQFGITVWKAVTKELETGTSKWKKLLITVFAPGAGAFVAIKSFIKLVKSLGLTWTDVANGVIGAVESMTNALISGLRKSLETLDSFLNKIVDALNKIRLPKLGRLGLPTGELYQPFNLDPVNIASIAPDLVSFQRVGIRRNDPDSWDDMTTEALDAAFPASGVRPEIGGGAFTPTMPTFDIAPTFTAKGGTAGEKKLASGAMMSDLMEWSRTRMEAIEIQQSNIRKARTAAIANVLGGSLTQALHTFGAGGSMEDQAIMEQLVKLADSPSIEEQQLRAKKIMASPITVNFYSDIVGDPVMAGEIILAKIKEASMAGASLGFLTEG